MPTEAGPVQFEVLELHLACVVFVAVKKCPKLLLKFYVTCDVLHRMANDSRLYEALRDNTVLVSLEARRCCLGLDNKSGSAVDLLWQAL